MHQWLIGKAWLPHLKHRAGEKQGVFNDWHSWQNTGGALLNESLPTRNFFSCVCNYVNHIQESLEPLLSVKEENISMWEKHWSLTSGKNKTIANSQRVSFVNFSCAPKENDFCASSVNWLTWSLMRPCSKGQSFRLIIGFKLVFQLHVLNCHIC